jgi:glycyl-tRNA synthetase beta chain
LYAEHQGEPHPVAIAIEEGWLPRFAGDAVAKWPAGLALALADRLDTLTGCFGIGMIPKGGGDPQGLRRSAIGIVNSLLGHRLDLDLGSLFAAAVAEFHAAVRNEPAEYQGWNKERGTGESAKDAEGLVAQLVGFAQARLSAQAVDEGAPADFVDAVIAADAEDARHPVRVTRKIAALRALSGTADFVPLLQMFKRVLNISRPHADARSRAVEAREPAELALLAAVDAAESRAAGPLAARDYERVLAELFVLRDPIARFFDDVLVDDPDADVRARRIGLLQRVGGLLSKVADFSRITTR